MPLRELQEALFELKNLRDSRGFKRFLIIAREQSNSRKDTLILTPLKSMDEVLGQEYAKGEVAGIDLMMTITDAEIDSLETEIAELLKEENENVEKP